VECWTSAIEADVYRTGELVSKRMDVLISRDFRVSKGVSCNHNCDMVYPDQIFRLRDMCEAHPVCRICDMHVFCCICM
jgi:hypothetical protein